MATYCFTDIHGMYELWEQIRDYCKPEDTIYFLGDAGDRGKDGIKIMIELLKDPRVKYIKGNHEDMLDIVVSEMVEYGLIQGSPNVAWWKTNGGGPTIEEFNKLSEGTQEWLYKKIVNLPLFKFYTNKKGQKIFLSHAGTHPTYTERDRMLFGKQEPLLWDRKHFKLNWPREGYKDYFIVHGHTPVFHLGKELNEIQEFKDEPLIKYSNTEIIKYANGHKIDIDLASFYFGHVALLNLDTLEVEKYFSID